MTKQIDDAELDRRFKLHRARTAADGDACQDLRDGSRDLASLIVHKTPPGREQAQALAALELVLFHGIAAIVRP